jgi:hypothetical protein
MFYMWYDDDDDDDDLAKKVAHILYVTVWGLCAALVAV